MCKLLSLSYILNCSLESSADPNENSSNIQTLSKKAYNGNIVDVASGLQKDLLVECES